jgi:hypothetical protein
MEVVVEIFATSTDSLRRGRPTAVMASPIAPPTDWVMLMRLPATPEYSASMPLTEVMVSATKDRPTMATASNARAFHRRGSEPAEDPDDHLNAPHLL